jgi:hypothetical protein
VIGSLNSDLPIKLRSNTMNWNKFAFVLTVINVILLIGVLIQTRILASQTIPEVLRVHAFELVDEAGRVRAQLTIDETNGEVVFRLRDRNEMIRVKLGASEEGSGLVLINDLTEPGVHILAKEDQTSLTLTDHNGAKQVIEP